MLCKVSGIITYYNSDGKKSAATYLVTVAIQFTGLINNAPSLVFNTNDYRFGSPVLASSDILLIPSPDGYKLRLYYTDGNCRSLVAWEFDCIDK